MSWTEGLGAAWRRARERHGWLDHAARAAARFDEVDAPRLAAATTYYGFFAAFALALVGFAALGFVLAGDPGAADSVQDYLDQNLPTLNVQAIQSRSGQVGLIGLAGLVVAGLSWVDSLRTSVRGMFGLNPYPGNYFLRKAVDLAVLIGLALLLSASLAAAFGVNRLVQWVVESLDATGPMRWLLTSVGFLVGMAVNAVLAVAILTGLPRLAVPPRRLWFPALLVAAGIEALRTVGRIYIDKTEANPAYQVVAAAAGLLVFLYLMNQLILFAAALAATSEVGTVADQSAAAWWARRSERREAGSSSE